MHLLIDPSNNYYLYYDKGYNIISSSWMAVYKITQKSSNIINKQALREILLTGNLIGSETISKDIFKYIREEKICIDGIEIHNHVPTIKEPCKSDYEGSVSYQLEVLSSYFDSVRELCEEFGASSAITSGLDSRLLFVLLNNRVKNIQYFTTWRNNNINELIAKEICYIKGYKIVSEKHRPPIDLNSEEFIQRLHENMFYNDGQIRTHQLWIEEINSENYRNKIIGDKRISIGGVGGEQYRNNERLVRGRYHIYDWIKYEYLRKDINKFVLGNNYSEEILENIIRKVKSLLSLSSDYIDYVIIKRFMNEIYNPANRTLRNNIENKNYFFLTPFTEYLVSRNAYLSVNHLGVGFEFEMSMIRRMDPEISRVMTDYGFSLEKREPFYRLGTPVLKSIVGIPAYNRFKYLFNRNGNLMKSLLEKDNNLSGYINIIEDLNLGINIQKVKNSDYLSPLLIQSGYLIDKLGMSIE